MTEPKFLTEMRKVAEAFAEANRTTALAFVAFGKAWSAAVEAERERQIEDAKQRARRT